ERLDLYLDCRRTAERCSLWFLRHRRPPVDIAAEVARFRDPLRQLAPELQGCLHGPMKRAMQNLVKQRVKQGVPEDLAMRSVVWRLLHTAFDVIELADRAAADPLAVATAYWELFDRLELLWLWDAIGALPRADRWQTQARGALRDDLLTALALLTSNVIGAGDGSVTSWLQANDRSADRASALLVEIRRADSYDVTNLSVALRQLRNLAQTSVRNA
ncbi:MAG TPA: hypothetical protein VLA10_02710, partial [Ilumatobacter sp.]|nr:hypothetical protein [Ilumatobacter sp.]